MTSYLASSNWSASEPGGCVAIARYGHLQHLECRGLAQLPEQIAINGDTNFRLASVSKQFTAAAILLLREQGRLSLEDPVTAYLPQLANTPAGTPRLIHLLQHTSGLLDYEDYIPDDAPAPVRDADVLRIAGEFKKSYFSPGSEFRYSNTGYALLACIVEELVGRPYCLALESMIFHPLGMQNTVARDVVHRPEVAHRALGYRRIEDNTFIEADQSMTSSVLGDGGIYSSVQDYLKWDRALWSGALLPLDVVKHMMTPGYLQLPASEKLAKVWFPDDMNEPQQHAASTAKDCAVSGATINEHGCAIPYGLGWRLEKNGLGLDVAYHPGSTTGFMHCVRRVPELGLTVIVFSNRTVSRSKELARDIEKQFLAGSC